MSAQPTLCITCLLLCITLCITCDVSHRNYPTCNTKPDIVDGLITILPMPLIIIVCLCTCCCICYFNRCCCFRRKEPTSNPGLNLQNLEHRKSDIANYCNGTINELHLESKQNDVVWTNVVWCHVGGPLILDGENDIIIQTSRWLITAIRKLIKTIRRLWKCYFKQISKCKFAYC